MTTGTTTLSRPIWPAGSEALIPYLAPEALTRLRHRLEEQRRIQEWMRHHDITICPDSHTMAMAMDLGSVRMTVRSMNGWLRKRGHRVQPAARNFFLVDGGRMHWRQILVMANRLRALNGLPSFRIGGL